MPGNFFTALLIAGLAGLASSIGAFLGIIGKAPGCKTLSLSMGFSAGVMILAAFGCMLVEAQGVVGRAVGFAVFVTGMAGMLILDVVVPHEYFAEKCGCPQKGQVFKAGLLAAIGLGIHNFPEGIAVFSGGLHDIRLGWALAGAVALHNIPEGLAVSVPVYAATGSRARAFWWGALSGLAEPVGAVLAGIALNQYMSPVFIAYVLAATAGIMVFIALDELLPIAQASGEGHLPITGLIAGMAVMAAGLWLLGMFGL